MSKTNIAMNDYIRMKAGATHLSTNTTKQTAPTNQPSGNAGNGTGSPPAPSKFGMNAFIRLAAGK